MTGVQTCALPIYTVHVPVDVFQGGLLNAPSTLLLHFSLLYSTSPILAIHLYDIPNHFILNHYILLNGNTEQSTPPHLPT